MRLGTILLLFAGASLCSALFLADSAQARTRVNVSGAAAARGGTAGGANLQANRSAERSANLSANRNVDRNVERSVDRNVNVDVDDHYHYHPFATAAVVGTGVAMGRAMVGATYWSLPPSCGSVMVNGVAYQQCGANWYQPQYSGTSVTYVAVNPPR